MIVPEKRTLFWRTTATLSLNTWRSYFLTSTPPTVTVPSEESKEVDKEVKEETKPTPEESKEVDKEVKEETKPASEESKEVITKT